MSHCGMKFCLTCYGETKCIYIIVLNFYIVMYVSVLEKISLLSICEGQRRETAEGFLKPFKANLWLSCNLLLNALISFSIKLL